MWSWLLGWVTMFLVWLSADPQNIALEDARAAAAVAAAKAAVMDKPRRRDDEAVPAPPKTPVQVPSCPDGKCPIR